MFRVPGFIDALKRLTFHGEHEQSLITSDSLQAKEFLLRRLVHCTPEVEYFTTTFLFLARWLAHFYHQYESTGHKILIYTSFKFNFQLSHCQLFNQWDFLDCFKWPIKKWEKLLTMAASFWMKFTYLCLRQAYGVFPSHLFSAFQHFKVIPSIALRTPTAHNFTLLFYNFFSARSLENAGFYFTAGPRLRWLKTVSST